MYFKSFNSEDALRESGRADAAKLSDLLAAANKGRSYDDKAVEAPEFGYWFSQEAWVDRSGIYVKARAEKKSESALRAFAEEACKSLCGSSRNSRVHSVKYEESEQYWNVEVVLQRDVFSIGD
jgi:hypothetical protein